MLPDTQYYVRVRHRGENSSESEWSDAVGFKTAQEGGLEETGICYGPATNNYFGVSVALSLDGNTALVGAYGWNSQAGKALVYTRSGSSWTQQADLTPALDANSFFGYSVSLSADGNTALVGAYYWNSATGKALIYTRSGSTWTEQADLAPALGTSSLFGVSVALSADGNTALVGASGWNTRTGKALVYTRSGSTWTQQADLPHALGVNSRFGYSVALCADGNTALVGANAWKSGNGEAFVYTRSGGTWTEQADLPHALGAGNQFGTSVALSADGSTALVGAPGWSSGRGKVLVYTRSGGTWTEQADLPHALEAGSQFGSSVALSADGKTALVGAFNWNTATGKVLVYTRSGSIWTLHRELDNPLGSGAFGTSVAVSGDTSTALVGAPSHNSNTGFVAVYEQDIPVPGVLEDVLVAEFTGPAASSQFGYSVALSADGSTALVGAYGWSNYTGKAFVYTRSGSTWTQQADLPHALTGSRFGVSAALSADGNTVLVGAWLWNSQTGKALVYTRSGSTWTQQADLAHSLGTNSQFGYSVTLSADGNTALVGARIWNSETGKALVYTRSGSTWTQQADLPHALGVSSHFGCSAALSADGNTALVGAYYWNSVTGKALVYTRIAGMWFLRRELTGAASSGFGISVSLSGDGYQAVIGAYAFSSTTGKAFFYQ